MCWLPQLRQPRDVPKTSQPFLASRGLGGFSPPWSESVGATSMWDTASNRVFTCESGGTGLLLVALGGSWWQGYLLQGMLGYLVPVHHDKYGYLRKAGPIPHLAVAVFVVACMSKAGVWWPLALPKNTVIPSAFYTALCWHRLSVVVTGWKLSALCQAGSITSAAQRSKSKGKWKLRSSEALGCLKCT